jgi:hypothetical protein
MDKVAVLLQFKILEIANKHSKQVFRCPNQLIYCRFELFIAGMR